MIDFVATRSQLLLCICYIIVGEVRDTGQKLKIRTLPEIVIFTKENAFPDFELISIVSKSMAT